MVVLITGVSKGLGSSLLHYFDKHEHQIIGVSRSGGNANFESLGSKTEIIQTDWTDIESLLDCIEDNLVHNKIDILINNAGFLNSSPPLSVEYDQFSSHFNANASLPALLTLGILKRQLFSEKAHIVNIGSMAGFQGAEKFPNLLAYSMSKAALACFTECISRELGRHQSINCLCLGSFDSDMFRNAFPDQIAAANIKDVTEYVAQFALSAGSVMSGKVIPVNFL